MPFLIYSVLGIAIFKIVVDALGGDALAPYSVLLETLVLGFLFAMLVRTSILQKEGRREALKEKLDHLRKSIGQCE